MEENEQSIDLRVLLKVLRDHLLPIAAATLIAAAIGFILSALIIPKQYTSEALMYVENNSDNTGSSLNINDINAAQKIVNTCQILFTSNDVLSELSNSFDSYSVGQLRDMVVIESVNSTEVLRISVTSLDPQTSADMAWRMVELSISEFQRVLENGSIKMVSSPQVPRSHTFPSIPQFTVIGMLIGMVVSYVVFLIIELIDVKVKPGDDLMQMYGIPVFAEIMDFEISDKGSYKYHYYSTSTPDSSDKPSNRSGSHSSMGSGASASSASSHSSHSSGGGAAKSSTKRKENA